jgi:hypothetical protein
VQVGQWLRPSSRDAAHRPFLTLQKVAPAQAPAQAPAPGASALEATVARTVWQRLLFHSSGARLSHAVLQCRLPACYAQKTMTKTTTLMLVSVTAGGALSRPCCCERPFLQTPVWTCPVVPCCGHRWVRLSTGSCRDPAVGAAGRPRGSSALLPAAPAVPQAVWSVREAPSQQRRASDRESPTPLASF